MKQQIKKATQGLPSWAKGIIAIAIVGVSGFVLYKVYQKVKAIKSNKNLKETVNAAQNEAKKYEQEGIKLTHPESLYTSTANYIAQMLDGCEKTTTELMVVQKIMIAVENKLDWVTLITKFGTRTIDNCGIGTGDTTYDLPSLLTDQLDGALAYYKVENGRGYKDSGATSRTIGILRKYLATKGITL